MGIPNSIEKIEHNSQQLSPVHGVVSIGPMPPRTARDYGEKGA